MKITLKNCWELLHCERHAFGAKVNELGECIASREKLGHSCWAIAGTLCGGFVQQSVTDKQKECMSCKVYRKYHRSIGTDGKKIQDRFPAEEEKYRTLLLERMNSRM